MDRRTFCSRAAFLGAAFPFFRSQDFSGRSSFTYVPVVAVPGASARLPVPEGRRIAFGLDYFTLDSSGAGVLLRADGIPGAFQGEAYLRLQVAIDTREMTEVDVLLGRSGQKVGQFSIWYPTGLQVFDVKLDCNPALLAQEGVRLRMTKGRTPLYFYATTDSNGSHILLNPSGNVAAENTWHNLLCSDRSLQPFDWLEGCVLDGLQNLYDLKKDKKALATIKRHLDHYLVDDRNLIYVDLWARPKDNKFTNLEVGNNFAVIARHRPDHPSVSLFLAYCEGRFGTDSKLKPDSLTAEGLYTLAYPLSVMGHALKKPELFERSLIEAEERIALLLTNNAIYRMGSRSKGVEEINRNWSRGVVWFLLGLVQTAESLGRSPLGSDSRVKKLKEVYQESARIVLKFQQLDDGWKSFMDLEETGFESSGTAGLAAALAHGHRLGWLPEFDKKRLARVHQRLLKSMTPDGFLAGTTQHNAGSYELMQKGTYRVISQYTMGLLGHINAHL